MGPIIRYIRPLWLMASLMELLVYKKRHKDLMSTNQALND